MTQEEKNLLLKDLSARLPYKVIVQIVSYGQENERPWFGDLSCQDLECFMLDVAYKSMKPYLRPISSMTEEEKVEYCDLQDKFLCSSQYPVTGAYELFDWLNAHHFDYRGLINKRLAIEAPENMYNVKKQ